MTVTGMLNDHHSLLSPVVAHFACSVSPTDWFFFLLDMWPSHSFNTTQVNLAALPWQTVLIWLLLASL
jgi:hypothetical protein